MQGNPMDIYTLEPAIKEYLTERSCSFIENHEDADSTIRIQSNTITGSEYDGIYFAYLDINLSVFGSNVDNELFSAHIDQIKGGGNDYLKAGKKAYLKGFVELINVLSESDIFN